MTALNEEAVVPEFAHAVRGYDRYQVDDYIERLNEWASGAHTRALEAERIAQQQSEEMCSLRERLADAEEQHPGVPDDALRQAAERSAEAVKVALTQADEIRRRAAADAERRLDEASRQAASIVESARQSVAGFSQESAKERKEVRRRLHAMLEDGARQADQLRREAREAAESTIGAARGEAARIVAEAQARASEVAAQSDEERRHASDAVGRLQAEREEIVGELSRLRGAIHSLISGAQTLSRFESGDQPTGEPTVVLDQAPPTGRRVSDDAAPRDGQGA